MSDRNENSDLNSFAAVSPRRCCGERLGVTAPAFFDRLTLLIVVQGDLYV